MASVIPQGVIETSRSIRATFQTPIQPGAMDHRWVWLRLTINCFGRIFRWQFDARADF
jgi:hypothetical protein